MFKKFFSNALLSVVMDKTARKKLEAIRTKKKSSGETSGKTSGKTSGNSKKTKTKKTRKPIPTETDDLLNMTINEALEEARREAATPDAHPRIKKPALPAKPPRLGGAEREKLIAEAMNIHRQKTHILNDLDPAALDKLTLMATYALDPDSLPPEIRKELSAVAKSEGLVDQNGRIRSPRKAPRKPGR